MQGQVSRSHEEPPGPRAKPRQRICVDMDDPQWRSESHVDDEAAFGEWSPGPFHRVRRLGRRRTRVRVIYILTPKPRQRCWRGFQRIQVSWVDVLAEVPQIMEKTQRIFVYPHKVSPSIRPSRTIENRAKRIL